MKHAMGLTAEDIELCLKDAELTLEDVDFISLSATQLVEYVLMDPAKLSIALEIMPEHRFPCTLVDELKVTPEEMLKNRSGWLGHLNRNLKSHPYHRLFPDLAKYADDEKKLFGSFEYFVNTPL